MGQEWYMTEDLEGSGRIKYKTWSTIWRERLNKTTEITVMAICKLVRIGTRKFPKANLGFVSALRRLVVCVNAINARWGVEA